MNKKQYEVRFYGTIYDGNCIECIVPDDTALTVSFPVVLVASSSGGEGLGLALPQANPYFLLLLLLFLLLLL